MARFFQPKKKTQLNTKHQVLKIEKLDHHGAGIAYQNKKPIFVEGALPGEEVIAQLTESKSKFSRASLIKIQSASSQRIEPFCPHYSECGGCNMQHLSSENQWEYKQQTLSQLMSKFARQTLELELPILSRTQGYRRRARVSVMQDKKTRQLQFGFRKKNSNNIVNLTHCPVLEPDLNAILPDLSQLLQGFSQPEHIGHVELVKADNTCILVLCHTKALPARDHQSIIDFANAKQISLYLMPSSKDVEIKCGESGVYQEIGLTIPFEPNNFIQVNQEVNAKMVTQALDWLALSSQDTVLDLFCGLGNFSLPMAKLVNSVVGIEGIDEMVEKAAHNAQINNLENATFFQANLEQDVSGEPWANQKFDKILLDPARAGANGVIEKISVFGATRIVYVSCNPATLARDSRSLLEQGYELKRLGMLDMFPHTSHLESMALFVKAK
ncbi:23S rRNA (uracil(1939)-C(5))-methyltransferase RlmD [Vibrio tetraodonis]|uniref:23S rRNA (uracil(1939)-C(5))-methyltransferase RlmD n=1 Tax=Vibrio tetraodonis TaxID=2231647 RepID=UPI000E0C1759|nr:23S rRNA (uracil(1939)-C(5))-methyltransferase RlmD [Vibrio tetraodonis]